MKRKLLTGLSLAPLLVAAACSNPTTEPDQLATETTTLTVEASAAETATATVTATETGTATVTVTKQAPQPPVTNAPTPNGCESRYGGWSTTEDSTAITMVRDSIYDVRIGRHDCFDRIVIDVDTTEDVGFHARYVPEVRQFGSGLAVPVAGEAALELVIDAPLAMSVYDNPPAAFTTTPNWETLREVKNAGTFEGITKLAIGVESKVKFGVYHHTGSDGKIHVVVDLVHSFG